MTATHNLTHTVIYFYIFCLPVCLSLCRMAREYIAREFATKLGGLGTLQAKQISIKEHVSFGIHPDQEQRINFCQQIIMRVGGWGGNWIRIKDSIFFSFTFTEPPRDAISLACVMLEFGFGFNLIKGDRWASVDVRTPLSAPLVLTVLCNRVFQYPVEGYTCPSS